MQWTGGGALESGQFPDPSSELIKKGSYYRLALTKQKEKVAINRKKIKQDETTISRTTSASDRNNSYATDHDFMHDFEEDFDFDGDEYSDLVDIVESQETRDQVLYKKMCSALKVVPINHFYRELPTTTVHLTYYDLSFNAAKACATALMDNTTVSTLHLHENGLGPDGTRLFVAMLAENVRIKDLAISNNSIGHEVLKELTQVLKNNTTLESLDLSGNNFDEADAELLAYLIENCSLVKSLNLSHNCFRESGGIHLGHALGNNDCIIKLDLKWNHLRRKGAAAIANALQRNSTLEDLDISWNGFYLNGCKEMTKALRVNQTLKRLNMASNRIDYECLEWLVRGLCVNTSLSYLILSHNPLSSQGAELLMEMVKSNRAIALREIDIRTQAVEERFLNLLDEINSNDRSDDDFLLVRYGIFIDQKNKNADGDSNDVFASEDPMMVLVECAKMLNFRLIDMFYVLDKDRSNTLEFQEFKQGLLSYDVPMSEKAVDLLVKKLDKDGDGVIDFQELVDGQKAHQSKLRRLKLVEKDLPFEETELGRIQQKLKYLTSKRQKEREREAEERRNNSKLENAAKTTVLLLRAFKMVDGSKTS